MEYFRKCFVVNSLILDKSDFAMARATLNDFIHKFDKLFQKKSYSYTKLKFFMKIQL